jgi:hypothetical protein
MLIGLASVSGWAANVVLPGGALTVLGVNPSGASFTYTGTLTQNDTITLTVSGSPCLQTSGTQYCTNAAGVIRTAGFGGGQGVGQATLYSSFYYGALIMNISGVGEVQVFPTNAGNGLGSGAPPATLSISGATLQSLGFGAFSVNNPTITFYLGDTGYGDNGGQFNLTQTGSTPIGTPISTRTLIGMTVALALIGIYQLNARMAQN